MVTETIEPTVLPSRPKAPGRLASRRFWIYLAVIVTWLGVMAQLWLREGGRGGLGLRALRINPEVLLVSWTDVDQCMWLEQNGKRIGLSTLNISQISSPAAVSGTAPEIAGFDIDSRALLYREILGLYLPVEIASLVRVNTSFEMETMQLGLRLAGKEIRIQAFVEDRNLYYFARLADAPAGTTREGGGWDAKGTEALLGTMFKLPRNEVCGRAPLLGPIFLSDAVLPLLTRTTELKVGERWVTQASNPLAGLASAASIQVTVEAREQLTIPGKEPLDAWRLAEEIGELRSTLWYDVQGRLQRSVGPGGVRQERALRTQAEEAYPAIKKPFPFADKIDKEWIRQHLEPKLDGTPLENLIPSLPGLDRFQG